MASEDVTIYACPLGTGRDKGVILPRDGEYGSILDNLDILRTWVKIDRVELSDCLWSSLGASFWSS